MIYWWQKRLVRLSGQLLFAASIWLTSAQLWAENGQDAAHLGDFSLQELLDLDVRLPLRVSRPLYSTPSAVYVLSADAIRRSGATTIPELLRLVPGVEVTRFGSGKWGVGIRGFNGGVFTNRLLILMDGRSVFSPAKVGMFWDSLDTFIPDIERIVVVRGPGAALWGSNAINGVVNIITRKANDDPGGLAYIGAGTRQQGMAGLRYAGALGNDWQARGYLKAFEREATQGLDGQSNRDPWRAMHAGMRMDQQITEDEQISLQLDTHRGLARETLLLPRLQPPVGGELVNGSVDYFAASFQARWEKDWNDHSESHVQFFHDRSKREDLFFNLDTQTYDIDAQYDYRWSSGRRLSSGLSYRYTSDKLPDQYLRFDPQQRNYDVWSAFTQLEQPLPFPGLDLIVGAKLEQNDFSGTEVQPNVRLIWSQGPKFAVWSAISRANRTPSRTEHDVTIDYDLLPLGPDQLLQLQIRGDERFDSEKLTAYELGLRHRTNMGLKFDLALFLNTYEGLRTLEPGEIEPSLNPPPQLFLPVISSNGANARSWGGELLIEADIHPQWKMEFSYSFVRIVVDTLNSQDPSANSAEKESPRHRMFLKSAWDITSRWELNTSLRYVGPVLLHQIPSYTELDLTAVYRLSNGIELSLSGRNLLSDSHEEFIDRVVGTPSAVVEREAYAKLSLKF